MVKAQSMGHASRLSKAHSAPAKRWCLMTRGSSRIELRSEKDDRSQGTEETSANESDPMTRTCPDCDGPIVRDEGQAELHCEECGRVIEADRIDTGPEWRKFDDSDQEQKSRVGAPPTERLHDRGLSTVIGWADQDSYGNPLPTKRRRRMQRMRIWDERFRTKDNKERHLRYALGEINRMASGLGLPERVKETSSMLYRRALDEDMIRGRSIEAMASAALYGGSRIEGAARTKDEIIDVSRVNQIEIMRAYRYLTRELSLKIPPTDPEAYIGRFSSQLDCSDETERHARELVRAAVAEWVHSGRNPVGIAAGALYAASTITNEELYQQDIAEVASMSEVTIRNRYTEILDAAEASEKA